MNTDVVIYQSSDGLVKMEAIVDASNETIWATQKAMAELFGVTVPNISYHFKRIFSSGELEPEMVIKEILITAQSGFRGLSEEKVLFIMAEQKYACFTAQLIQKSLKMMGFEAS